MTTASGAFAVIRARCVANKPAGLSAFRFQGEDADTNGDVELPDTPAAFAYVEFLAEPAQLVSYGGGRGANRYRHPMRIVFYVFVPRGVGLSVATDLAEQLATLFRSYRDDDISCFDATVYPGGNGADLKPPGLSSEVNNYFWASVEVSGFYDLIG
jgi:hypothetical protein